MLTFYETIIYYFFPNKKAYPLSENRLYPVRDNAPLLPPSQAPPRKGSCPGGRLSLRTRGSSEPEAEPEAAAGLSFLPKHIMKSILLVCSEVPFI